MRAILEKTTQTESLEKKILLGSFSENKEISRKFSILFEESGKHIHHEIEAFFTGESSKEEKIHEKEDMKWIMIPNSSDCR